MDFFRKNYIQRTINQPSSTTTITPAAPVTTSTTVRDTATAATDNIVPEETKTAEYAGPYDKNIKGEHYFVFVIPTIKYRPACIYKWN